MSTGAGKTVTGAYAVMAHLKKLPTGKVLWIAHRDELVSQAYDTLTDLGLECGVLQANPSRPVNPFRQVQIASVQTLVARQLHLEEVTFFVYDECHHAASDGWSTHALWYKNRGAYGLGLTATPVRSDNLPLGDVFDEIVCPISMRELIQRGLLVPYELFAPRSKLKSRALAVRPVDAYLEKAKGRKTIVFAANVADARRFAEDFNDAGISAAVVTGETPTGERVRMLRAFKDGVLSVICNVGVLTEGFDDPSVSCVILARSVGSVALYLQMLGRGLRISPETGKTNAILIDLCGSSILHGEPDADREYSLEGEGIRRKKLEAAPERFCAVCGVLMEADASICTECGTVPAGLVPPDILNVPLEKYGRMRALGPEQRVAALAKWVGKAMASGHKLGAALHRYKHVFGDWPTDEIKRAAIAKAKEAPPPPPPGTLFPV